MRDDTDDNFEWVTNTDGRRVRVLRDGGVTRVPLQLMDGVQRAIHDTYSNDLEHLRTLRDDAHRERNHRDENAWRAGDASNNNNDKGFCPNCGFNLLKGYMTRAGGDGDETDELDDAAPANPHSARFDLDSARAARDAARAARELEDQAAWRKGKY